MFSCSTFVDGFELPTRLAVAAADCILVLTEALTKKEFLSRATSSQKLWTDSKKKSELIKMISLSDSEKERNQTQVTDASDDIGSEFLLWHYLNELVILVEKLEAVIVFNSFFSYTAVVGSSFLIHDCTSF